jgi:hypothetical protein
MVYDIKLPESYASCNHDRHHDVTPEIKKREKAGVIDFDQGDTGDVFFGNFGKQEKIKANPDYDSGNYIYD